MIVEAIARLVEGQSLTRDEAAATMADIMEERSTPAQFGAFVTALRLKGETVDEIAGMAQVMRRKALRVPTELPVVDTCGTGGDGSGSFNVSTAAAFVVAAAGRPVAKHGNRGMSSQCGSADVLEALGASVTLGPDAVARCMDEVSIAGPTRVYDVRGGAVSEYDVHPEQFGLERGAAGSVRGGDAAVNAAIIRSVLSGQPNGAAQGARRDIVVLNAAAALVAGGGATDLNAGVQLAADVVKSGAA